MIRPDSVFKKIWDLFIFLLTIFICIEIPLRIVFNIAQNKLILFFEISVSCFYLIDIILTFFTPIKVGVNFEYDKKKIAKKYLKSWFIVDFLAFFPFFILIGSYYAGINRAFRFIRILQFSRMIRVLHLSNIIERWNISHVFNPSFLRLGFFAFSLSLLSHWIACGWVYLGGAQLQPDYFKTYIDAIYWTITTLTAVGYGDITPDTAPQKLFTMAVMLTGVGSYGYVIGNIASLLANRDLIKANQLKKIEELSSFLKYRNVPVQLKHRIHDYYGHLWDHRMDTEEADLLADLPIGLRTDLAIFLYRSVLNKVPLFKNARPGLIRDIALVLKPRVFPADTVFIEKGETGESMYFISSGRVEVISEDGKVVYATLREGDFVGEIALLLDQPRNASVRTVGYVDAYELTKKDFLRAVSHHPNFKKYLNKAIQERLLNISKRQ